MSRPTIDVTIDENYLIEALTGPAHVSSYLDAFPENIFDTSPDSRLYKFLYTLLGPAGVSYLKLNYFYARLQLEEHGLQNDQLDKLYGNPFKFARNFNESYLENWKGVLDSASWDLINALDESYRQRAIDYFHAARLGSTVEGMRLASKSALGHDTRIVENYQHVFNQHSDQILNYNLTVNSNRNGYYNLEEFTVSPNDPSIDGLTANEIQTIDQINIAENYIKDNQENAHLLDNALKNLKPVNTVYNLTFDQSDTSIIETNNVLSTSEFHQVNRFVTGNPAIAWPNGSEISNDFSSIYWIEASVEKEAPKGRNNSKQHYQGFYKPDKITNTAGFSHKGSLDKWGNGAVVKKFPALAGLPNDVTWTPDRALANYTEPLEVTHKDPTTNKGLINDIYPTDYFNLEGVSSIQYNENNFWISAPGYDGEPNHLEISLSKTEGVNFIIFEILSAPINVEIEFRENLFSTNISEGNLKPVSFDPLYPNDTSLDYEANSLNKWVTCSYTFDMVFSSSFLISFKRDSSNYLNQSSFLVDNSVNPPQEVTWPIVVRNLRIGRNIV